MKQYLFLFAILLVACISKEEQLKNNELQIHALHKEYVEGWKEMDEERVMSLLENDAMIQPNRLTPIVGKEKIRAFWFPKDSSKTIINTFDTEIIGLNFKDSIAIMTHESLLDWDYQKDTISFGMRQKGINTTIYRKQKDNSWKVWRSMWTDILATPK